MVMSAGRLPFSENNGKLIRIMHDIVMWKINAKPASINISMVAASGNLIFVLFIQFLFHHKWIPWA